MLAQLLLLQPCPPAPPFIAGYREGCAGLPTSQMHSSPSAPPDASRLGLRQRGGSSECSVRVFGESGEG